MATATDFGLYPTRERIVGQRVAAGRVFTLGTPVLDGGVTRFRQSLWLAVPAAARNAVALQLAASALVLRFEPVSLDLGTDDGRWFPEVKTEADNQTVRIGFTWPASVTRLDDPSAFQRGVGFALHRAEGDAVAGEPVMRGQTGVSLSPPWVGTPMVVKMDQPVRGPALAQQVLATGPVFMVTSAGAAPMVAMAAAANPALAPAAAVDTVQARLQPQQRLAGSWVVPGLRLRGVPTSPRATLTMEARGDQPETLLWQSLLPGEQGTVTLPPQPLADEWAKALEQVRKRLAAELPRPDAQPPDPPPSDAPQLLRLDIESDAPARVTLLQATLALDAEFNSLAAELRADFDGSQPQTLPLPLDLPAGITLQGLTLSGRVSGGTDAAAAALPAGTRPGLLLSAADRVLVATPLAGPLRPGGLALAWWPLSEQLVLKLRLLADAGDTPGAVALAEWSLAADTPAAAWLALRGDAPDLQAQRLWLELCLVEGSGLWLSDANASPPALGFSEQREGASAKRQPLGLQPVFNWLPATLPDADKAPRQVALLAGELPIAAALDPRFTLECPAQLLPAIATSGLQARCGSAAQLTLMSARARLRLA